MDTKSTANQEALEIKIKTLEAKINGVQETQEHLKDKITKLKGQIKTIDCNVDHMEYRLSGKIDFTTANLNNSITRVNSRLAQTDHRQEDIDSTTLNELKMLESHIRRKLIDIDERIETLEAFKTR